MKQLKPRDKITQKMTRDGAVEINETQQTAERISSREADSVLKCYNKVVTEVANKI